MIPNTTDSMKDWPLALRKNAAIIELAAAIYKARGEVYGGSTTLHDQPPAVHVQYITRADELLKTLAPPPQPAQVAPIRRPAYFDHAVALTRAQFATGLRATGAPVIGATEPTEDGAA